MSYNDKSIQWYLGHILMALLIMVGFKINARPKLWLYEKLNKTVEVLKDAE